MKILVAVILYNRTNTLKNWLRAWAQADQMGATLVVIHSLGAVPGSTIAKIASDNGVLYKARQNLGMDIGALREIIGLRTMAPGSVAPQALRDWDTLYWSTDDTLPMRPDFLQHFMQRFDSQQIGLVGNYLLPKDTYPSIPEHMRTVAFALRREAAARLVFPPLLYNKYHCWDFEYGTYNMHKQVQRMNMLSVPADRQAWPYGPKPWYLCNDYVWDCGEINTGVTWDWRRQQDHTSRFEMQFDKPVTPKGAQS
jgi:GT2 family glycosyltransferase